MAAGAGAGQRLSRTLALFNPRLARARLVGEAGVETAVIAAAAAAAEAVGAAVVDE